MGLLAIEPCLRLFVFILSASLLLPFANANEELKKAKDPLLCASAKEFKQAMSYLKDEDNLIVPYGARFHIADRIAKGCNGSADRFEGLTKALKKIGVSDKGSVEIALEVIQWDPEAQKSFAEIFKFVYLPEYFNLDYRTAFNTALEFSKFYKGSPQKALDDFRNLTTFCLRENGLSLPLNVCAKLVIQLAKASSLHKEGVFLSFYKLYKELNSERRLGYKAKDALELAIKIVRFGPQATENFLEGFDYAINKEGLDLEGKSAVQFGLRMARFSYQKELQLSEAKE